MLHLKHCKKFEKKWLFLSFCNSACISEVDYIKLGCPTSYSCHVDSVLLYSKFEAKRIKY